MYKCIVNTSIILIKGKYEHNQPKNFKYYVCFGLFVAVWLLKRVQHLTQSDHPVKHCGDRPH